MADFIISPFPDYFIFVLAIWQNEENIRQMISLKSFNFVLNYLTHIYRKVSVKSFRYEHKMMTLEAISD